jgi:ABC-type branched-subunit amino acid transport system substrate-binding protein
MKHVRSRVVGPLSVALVVGLLATGLAAGSASGQSGGVRGFDGKTITLASMGIASQFAPGIPNGVNARIQRFNDDNEIKGIELEWTEFVDDKQDVQVSLAEARRLVTQVGVFALVGDVSQTNPGDYFKQQQVPYFGWAFDNTYCSNKPSTSLWGFGYNGCLVPSDPSVMGDNGFLSYKYVKEKTGKEHPTLTVFGNESQSGKNAVKFQSIAYKGAGYDVVAQLTRMPLPPVPDFTPYVQDILTSNDGGAPDVVLCLLSTECLNIWDLVKANGYDGIFISSLYSNILTKALAGSLANVPSVPSDTTGAAAAGLEQMKKDLDAYEPGTSEKIDTATIAGYASTDMFIQALKTVAKKGKSNITPANVQKAAAKQTWQIKGLAGPTTYPQSTVSPYPTCTALAMSDGTTWSTVEPFGCSKKQYPVK